VATSALGSTVTIAAPFMVIVAGVVVGEVVVGDVVVEVEVVDVAAAAAPIELAATPARHAAAAGAMSIVLVRIIGVFSSIRGLGTYLNYARARRTSRRDAKAARMTA
jgi:hypothetical protein